VVGRVEQTGPGVDSAWQDRLVFVFHPHQSLFLAGVEHLLPVPTDVSADVAAMLPSMETAVSLVMDGQPLIGEHVMILGQGVVGLMVTTLLNSFPLSRLIVADYHEPRRQLALQLGADESVSPEELAATMADNKVDLCYELSGNPDALNVAIAHTGYTGRVVIGSWYGRKTAPLSLGGSFHRSRIKLISSQVSRLDPRWTGRWTKERRIQTAWRMLRQVQAHRLITRTFPIEQAALAYQLLDQKPDQAIQLLIDYSYLADATS
jgi:threonine dehydrogenase-like Zn-dependent dehydrogenase